ncbi:hypothetical protein HC928_04390 [bacterium]|nr:hypothetical protein [bacterium]
MTTETLAPLISLEITLSEPIFRRLQQVLDQSGQSIDAITTQALLSYLAQSPSFGANDPNASHVHVPIPDGETIPVPVEVDPATIADTSAVDPFSPEIQRLVEEAITRTGLSRSSPDEFVHPQGGRWTWLWQRGFVQQDGLAMTILVGLGVLLLGFTAHLLVSRWTAQAEDGYPPINPPCLPQP